MNEKANSVIQHIHDAQSWLAQARNAFQGDNAVRGELDLSLAQAEARYAWELSRGAREAKASARRQRTLGWWLPAAAGLCLIAIAVFVFPRLIAPHRRAGSGAERPPAITRSDGRGLAAPAQRESVAASPEPVAAVAMRADGSGAAKETVVPPADAAAQPDRQIGEVNPPAVPPVAEEPRAEPEPVNQVVAAGSNGEPAVDLRELERVAQETLTSGTFSSR